LSLVFSEKTPLDWTSTKFLSLFSLEVFGWEEVLLQSFLERTPREDVRFGFIPSGFEIRFWVRSALLLFKNLLVQGPRSPELQAVLALGRFPTACDDSMSFE